VRLLVSLFWKYGGFADANQVTEAGIIYSQSLRNRIEKGVADDTRGHVIGRSRPGGLPMTHERAGTERLRVLGIIQELQDRLDFHLKEDGYATMLAAYLRFFVRHANVFPAEHRENMIYFGTGVWLGLK